MSEESDPEVEARVLRHRWVKAERELEEQTRQIEELKKRNTDLQSYCTQVRLSLEAEIQRLLDESKQDFHSMEDQLHRLEKQLEEQRQCLAEIRDMAEGKSFGLPHKPDFIKYCPAVRAVGFLVVKYQRALKVLKAIDGSMILMRAVESELEPTTPVQQAPCDGQ